MPQVIEMIWTYQSEDENKDNGRQLIEYHTLDCLHDHGIPEQSKAYGIPELKAIDVTQEKSDEVVDNCFSHRSR